MTQKLLSKRFTVSRDDLPVLPPRKPKGHPDNYQRSRIMQCANHQAKVARMAEKWQQRHKKERCSLCKVKVTYRSRSNGANA